MAIPEPTRCCFYFIEEGTKNEHVAVGSNGNILRWANTYSICIESVGGL